MKSFLLIGQSNMAGPAITRWEEADNARLDGVWLLNAADAWEKAQNPLNVYSTVKRRQDPGLSPGVTLAEALRAATGEEIGIICNARGASKITEWQKGSLCFEEAVRRARAGCREKLLDGVMWLQGEQDTVDASDYECYAEKLSRFIRDLRGALGSQDIPFLAGEIWGDATLAPAEWRTGIQSVNRQIARVTAETPRCAFVSSAGLSHTEIEPVHFAPDGMRELGVRFAEAYIERFLNEH